MFYNYCKNVMYKINSMKAILSFEARVATEHHKMQASYLKLARWLNMANLQQMKPLKYIIWKDKWFHLKVLKIWQSTHTVHFMLHLYFDICTSCKCDTNVNVHVIRRKIWANFNMLQAWRCSKYYHNSWREKGKPHQSKIPTYYYFFLHLNALQWRIQDFP